MRGIGMIRSVSGGDLQVPERLSYSGFQDAVRMSEPGPPKRDPETL